jgi:hypothetical protein
MHNQHTFRSELPLDNSQQEEDAICFWMTNVLDLMSVSEQDVGQELSLRDGSSNSSNLKNNPKRKTYKLPRNPLQLPDYDALCRILNTKAVLNDTYDEEVESLSSSDENSSNDDSKSGHETTTEHEPSTWEQIMSSAAALSDSKQRQQKNKEKPLQGRQITITFRSNLPEDIPPTISAECVRYFYSAVLVVTTTAGEVIITDRPFSVLTCNSPKSITHTQSNKTSHTRVHIGELYAMAHSSSLPCNLSPIETLGERQLHVMTDPPVCSIVSRLTAERRTSTHRIQNENGALCAWLTLVGVGGPIAPGSRLGVIVKFPNMDDDEVGRAGTVPCHRVCCAVVGEEYAVCEGAAAASSSGAVSNKRKTRSYVFDSTYEMVESGYTDSISMRLLLPLDCPVTIKTDLVEVVVSLKLEFTVDRAVSEQTTSDLNDAETDTGFGVIRLEMPVELVHDDEVSNEEEEEDTSNLANITRFWMNGSAQNKVVGLDETGIHKDLKILSLRLMA